MEHPRIYAGVDTHSDTHTLALIDEYGRPLATQTFTADPTGYERLAAMIGDPDACLGVGVEGTNSYGAAPAGRLVKAGYDVYEVLRPKRAVRRRDGKSDPVDALAAARSVLAGDGTSVPKSTDGWVEALRAPDAERAQPVTVFLVKLVFRFGCGDGMLDSLSGRSRHRGEVFEGTAQARGGVVRAVASRLAGGTAHGDPLQSWRALFEVHGWSEARGGGALPDTWQASEQDHTPNGVSQP
ncbi:transposase [uncultured Bifidobacterium sp.]|uniref:IS110 family transposase n=1 Tax=uncultured Bifidobacterium sp. TaxID=165187 RepID=UPI0025985234|nr:transposase [uncultured Bifidobacterium sp.]